MCFDLKWGLKQGCVSPMVVPLIDKVLWEGEAGFGGYRYTVIVFLRNENIHHCDLLMMHAFFYYIAEPL